MGARWWLACVGVAALAATGCSKEGQFGGEGASCDSVATRVLGPNDASPLGFSGAQVLSAIGAHHTTTLTWAKGGSTGLTLDLGAPTEIRYDERRIGGASGGGVEPEIAMDCGDRVEIDVPLSFTTADGRFAEPLKVTLFAEKADEARFDLELNRTALHGTYQVTEVDPSKYSRVRLFVDGAFSAAEVHGSVHAQAESDGDSHDPNAAASAQNVPVATY